MFMYSVSSRAKSDRKELGNGKAVCEGKLRLQLSEVKKKIPAALATVSLDHIRKDFLEVLGLPLSLHGENISECGYTTV